jgi:hypothetical protein
MFNIVKRQDFMLGQDVPTWREAEELRLEKCGREHIVVIPADTGPGKEFTSTNFLRRLLKRRHRGARACALRTCVI